MKKWTLLILMAFVSVFPSTAAKVQELTAEEAIRMLEALSFASEENSVRKEAGIKKMNFPSVEPFNKRMNMNYEEVMSWAEWQKILASIAKTVNANKTTYAEAFITYDTIRRFNWNYPLGLYLEIFGENNLELYSMPLESGKKVANRIEHFKLYIEELAEMDINSRAEKAQTDFGQRIGGFIFWAATNFDKFYDAQKIYTDREDWKKRVEMAEEWSKKSSMFNEPAHQDLLNQAFGQEVVSQWASEYPDLVDGNTLNGLITLSVAVHLTQKREKEKMQAYNSLFTFFGTNSGAVLLKHEERLIKELRAFYKKHLSEVAKLEKKSK